MYPLLWHLKSLHFAHVLYLLQSRCSIVGIATSNGAVRPRGRSSSPCRVNNFYFSLPSRLALESTQPPIQLVPGAISQGVKRQGLEANRQPPTSVEVKKTWIYIYPLLHAPSWCSAQLVKRRWSEFLATDPEVRVRFPALPDFLRSSGSGTGSTQPRHNWGVTWKKT
jgi:hypothetical protein